MILFPEDKKYFIKRLVELITNISSIAGYKINRKKLCSSVPIINSSLKKLERTLLLTRTLRKMKYLGIKSTKEVEDLCNEN